MIEFPQLILNMNLLKLLNFSTVQQNNEQGQLAPANAVTILTYPENHSIEVVMQAYRTVSNLVDTLGDDKKQDLEGLLNEIDIRFTVEN